MKQDLKGKAMFSFSDSSNSEEKISKNIREIRQATGLTQEQFAAKIGVSFPTVNRWENQKAKPSPLALQKLQKFLLALNRKNRTDQGSLQKKELVDAY